MESKKSLMALKEREEKRLSSLEIGTEEYNGCFHRILEITKQLGENEDRWLKNILDGAKVVGGVVLPLIGLVGITAVEKDITFTGALRDYTKCFLPKKWF